MDVIHKMGVIYRTMSLSFSPSVILLVAAATNKHAIVLVDSNFVPNAATWRTLRNIRVVFDSGHGLHYLKKWCYPQNRQYTTYCTYCQRRTDLWPQESNTKEFSEIWTCFLIHAIRVRQTDRHTGVQTRW